MSERPVLDKNLDSKTFRDYYYLKEELVNFCRENGIPVSGGKIEITDRIAYFLDTGKILPAQTTRKKEKQKLISSSSIILIFEIFLQTMKENL